MQTKAEESTMGPDESTMGPAEDGVGIGEDEVLGIVIIQTNSMETATHRVGTDSKCTMI
jgi:hypothetical protein